MDETQALFRVVSTRSDRLDRFARLRKFDLCHTREAAQAEWANPKREGKPLPCDTQKLSQTRKLPRARRSYDGCMNTQNVSAS